MGKRMAFRVLESDFDAYWVKVKKRGTWWPATREGATMNTVGNRVFVIGGANRIITNDVFSYRYYADRWECIKPAGEKLPPIFGHTAVTFKDNIVIFGGETNYN